MKILNLREYGFGDTSLFLGTEMSPNVFEMMNLVRKHVLSFSGVASSSPERINCRDVIRELVRDEVEKCLNANGYFEFKPKEIQIGD